ncbi:DEAD/DEAH box helicase family protein [Kurthia zopfii]|uniref:DEAD/DEAH box helicase family protein n=1 Tax=Kurthia zopfii TaxID=1650 RepID=UPI000F70A809|nr:DEAD/DEAH box helicase family protein [Kurthia zopfii]VEI06071.1 Type III restriction enzyme, res subunit [Kurthia zopfii]
MNQYIKEDFTNEFMEKLDKEKFYLIGGECEVGKTTAIMEKLVPFAKKHHREVLYVCNRLSLKDQLTGKYIEETMDEYGVFKQNDNLTIGMYQSITKALEKGCSFLYEEKYDYIILDEAHLIYDAADYDLNSYLFMEFINKVDSIVVYMSGTPESINKLEEYMTKKLVPLRKVDKTNNPIGTVYLVEDKNVFESLRAQYLEKDYKWIELVSRSKQFRGVKNKLSNFKVSNLLSSSNVSRDLYMADYDDMVLKTVIEDEELPCELLLATKFLDVGVNINAHSNFVAAFNCVEMPNTLEQFRNRIRIKKDDPFHIDIIIYVQRPPKWQLDILKNKLKEINDIYDELESYERVIMEHNHAFGKRFRKGGVISEREYNPITKKLLEEKIAFFKGMYEAKNLIEFYRGFLIEMYPDKKIINYKALEFDYFLESLIGEVESINLTNIQQQQLRFKMKELRIDPRHSNELPHLNRINSFLKEEKIPYILKNPVIRIEGKQTRIWRLEKCAR